MIRFMGHIAKELTKSQLLYIHYLIIIRPANSCLKTTTKKSTVERGMSPKELRPALSSLPKQMHKVTGGRIQLCTAPGGGGHTALAQSGRWNQHKLKAPSSSFKQK